MRSVRCLQSRIDMLTNWTRSVKPARNAAPHKMHHFKFNYTVVTTRVLGTCRRTLPVTPVCQWPTQIWPHPGAGNGEDFHFSAFEATSGGSSGGGSSGGGTGAGPVSLRPSEYRIRRRRSSILQSLSSADKARDSNRLLLLRRVPPRDPRGIAIQVITKGL